MRLFPLATALLLTACGTTYNVPATTGTISAAAVSTTGSSRDVADFRRVKSRVEPAAEQFCREEYPSVARAYCNFQIQYDNNPESPPNAYQTRNDQGRPLIVLTASLLSQMRTDDEIAFVMAHEAGHHIASHLDKQQQSTMLGALVLGGLAAAAGGPYATSENIKQASDLGAFVGSRTYSQAFELEADYLGAFISARAGYDPEQGAQVFGRPALASSGGPVILTTHPASPRRRQTVANAAQEIRRQQASGLTPHPNNAP